MRKYKQMPRADLIDVSINSVLPRTILTSLTTLIALFALYFFGGEVIRGFNFAMIWGVFVGTYSSIFIASPVLILLGARSEAVALSPAKTTAPAGARPGGGGHGDKGASATPLLRRRSRRRQGQVP